MAGAAFISERPQLAIARETISFEGLGLSDPNLTRIIYKIGKPFISYDPTSAFNAITGIEAGEHYLLYLKEFYDGSPSLANAVLDDLIPQAGVNVFAGDRCVFICTVSVSFTTAGITAGNTELITLVDNGYFISHDPDDANNAITTFVIGEIYYIDPILDINLSAYGVTEVRYADDPPLTGYGWFSVKDYEAAGDGVTDDTAAIQATIDAAEVSGGWIVFPSGTYLVSSTLIGNTRDLKFIGIGDVIIKSNFIAGHVLSIYPLVTPPDDGTQNHGIQGLIIRDLVFESTVIKTSGAAIHVRYSEHAHIENIRIGHHITAASWPGTKNNFYDGIYMEKQGACHITGDNLITCSHDGLIVTGEGVSNGGTYFGYDGTLDGNFEFWGDTTAGSSCIHFAGGVSGFRVAGAGNLVLTEVAIKIDKTIINSVNTALLFNDFFIDSCINYGIYIAANSCNLLMMDNVWISSMGSIVGSTPTTPDFLDINTSGYPSQVCIYVETQLTGGLSTTDNGFTITGCTFKSGWGGGIQNYGANRWNIAGCSFNYLGVADLGGDGIFMSDGDHYNIVGNTFAKIGNATRGTGVIINGTATKLCLVGNTFSECGVAAYSGPAHDSANIICDSNAGGPNVVDTITITDTFTSANDADIVGRTTETGAKTWVAAASNTGVIEIVSSAAKLVTATTIAKYYIDAGEADVDISVNVGDVTTGASPLALLRYTDENNLMQVSLTNCTTYKVVAGVATEIIAAQADASGLYLIRIVLSGVNISVYKDGVLWGSSSAAALTASNHGIYFYNDTTVTTIRDISFTVLGTEEGPWIETGNDVRYDKTTTGAVSATVKNTNTGTGATASFNLINDDAKIVNFGVSSLGYTGNAFIGANSAFFYENAPGGFAAYIEGASFRYLVNGFECLWVHATATHSYLNFSNTLGSSGFGIRRILSTGVMEFKNSGGAWAAFGGGTSQWTDVTGGINYSGGYVGIGVALPDNPLDIRKDQNAGTLIQVMNQNAGTAAFSGFELACDGVAGYIYRTSQLYTGLLNALVIHNTGSGDVVIHGAAIIAIFKAGGEIRFASLAGTGTRMVIADADGDLSTQAIPSGLRFGVAGEDVTLTADRAVTGAGFDFEMTGFLSHKFSISSSPYTGLIEMAGGLTILNSVHSDGRTGTIELQYAAITIEVRNAANTVRGKIAISDGLVNFTQTTGVYEFTDVPNTQTDYLINYEPSTDRITYSSSNRLRQQNHTSGATVTITNQVVDVWLIVNPASTLAALTITFPTSPYDGQKIEISFGGTLSTGTIVTALGLTGPQILELATPTTGLAGDTFIYRYNSTTTYWYRLNN